MIQQDVTWFNATHKDQNERLTLFEKNDRQVRTAGTHDGQHANDRHKRPGADDRRTDHKLKNNDIITFPHTQNSSILCQAAASNTRSSQCSTTGVTKTVVCVILSVGRCV